MSDKSNHVSARIVENSVMLIRIERAEKRNALTNAMVCEIARHLTAATSDDAIRAVVLSGTADAFCAGADIAEVRATNGNAPRDPRRVRAWNTLQSFGKPIIAAVNGFAYGAGNELAMLCDFIIAGKNAKFGQPEVSIGGMAGDGGTQRLPRRVGSSFAAYMLFSGLPIDAETALRLGHVVEVVDVEATEARAIEIASVIASRAPIAVQATKEAIRACDGATLHNGLAFERELLSSVLQSPDNVEGNMAFLEKRPPRFTGRWG